MLAYLRETGLLRDQVVDVWMWSEVDALVAGRWVFLELFLSLDIFARYLINHTVKVLGVDLGENGQLLRVLVKGCVSAELMPIL